MSAQQNKEIKREGFSTIDIFTAVAIQIEIKPVDRSSDIEKNLKRCLELIDVAPQTSPTAKETYKGNWAPIKVVSFPEILFKVTKDTSVVSHKRVELFLFVLRERGNVQPG